MTDLCLFCGGRANTREDIIPKWYIRRFACQNESISLPNGTLLPYGKVVVPACKEDNGLFSMLERKMENDSFTEEEAYAWAFKIHAGFAYLDLRLKHVRSNPTSGPISVLGLSGIELRFFYHFTLWQFRHFVRIWKHPKRRFIPSPLGSVFNLTSNYVGRLFRHAPIGYVAVRMGERFLAVSLFDRGFAQQQGYGRLWDQGMQGERIGYYKSPAADFGDIYASYWLTHMAYTTLMDRVRPRLAFSERDVTVFDSTARLLEPLDREEFFLNIALQCGLYVTRKGARIEYTSKWPHLRITPRGPKGK